jgi:hypothetical protein
MKAHQLETRPSYVPRDQGLTTKEQARTDLGLPIHTATSRTCIMCGNKICVMCFKGTGVCSELCSKALSDKIAEKVE